MTLRVDWWLATFKSCGNEHLCVFITTESTGVVKPESTGVVKPESTGVVKLERRGNQK
jgi:hypothetical protein